MQLKKDTPSYAALKKHEDELIEALQKVDMVSLARSAVEYNLVPKEVMSHIQSLDPSIKWPHPLICRYLFFHVYATIQASEEKSHNAYKSWLTLLSVLNVSEVLGVLSNIQQSESCMERILARDLVHINDIPLLAKVLSGRQFSTCWKQFVYSIPLSQGDVSKFLSKDSSKALKQLLARWASKCPNASIELLEKTLRVCSNCFRDIKGLDVSNLVSSSDAELRDHILEKNGRIDANNYGALSSILKDYSAKLIKYASCLLLPYAEAKLLSNAICTMTPEECLNTVLTMWVRNQFHHARPPTFTNLVEGLPEHEKAKLKKCLMLKATNCQSFKIVTVWPSSSLYVTEGKSALLEIQASCTADSSVAFNWQLENSHPLSPWMITNRFHCLSVAILHVDVNSLKMEGTYKCKITHKTDDEKSQHTVSTPRNMLIALVKSQTFQLTVKTPLDEYRNILLDFHSEKPEVPNDTWPPVSIDSYINLALIKQAHITASSYHTIRGDVDDILNDKEAIVYNAVFDNLNSGTRLLVEGRPGSGKTTLVHKASKDWANGYLKFPHNRLLFLVHLRAFSSNPDVDLHDIVRCYSYIDSTVFTICKYAERHKGLGLCFILDGLDEYMPGDDSCFIFRLIRREIFPKAVIITASRPAAASSFRQYASTQVEVVGFLTQQIYEYVAKYPFSMAAKCNQLCQYLDDHPSVLHACYLPIHSAMVCFLFNELEDSNLPQTETEICNEFTKYMILRTLYRGAANDVCIESFDDLEPPQRNIFNKICRLAYEMTILSKQVMKETKIKSFFNVEDFLGLLTVDRTATRLGFQKMYTFLHLTAQEYLAAYYISKLDEIEQLKVIEEYGKQNQMQQVWKFFCGLARNVDSSLHKFEMLLGHSEYGTLYRVQCCFESQLSHFCDAVVEDSSLSFAENFLNSSNFEEVAYVISNTKYNIVKRLSFEGCNFGKEEVNVLLKKSDSEKLAMVTTLCLSGYQNCSTDQWSVMKYLVHSLSSLKVLDVSSSHIQTKEIHDFFKNVNHPNMKHILVGTVGWVLYAVRELNLMLVEESIAQSYHAFPYSTSADVHVLMPVKVLSRELMLHPALYKKIKSLSVFKNKFSPSDLMCMSKVLSQFPNLLSFDFSHNYLGDSVLPDTCSSMPLLLQRLDVSFNCLGTKGVETISNVLKQCSLLLELNIASNHIGSGGVKYLAEALKTCTKLEKLVLHSNYIRNEGVQALAKSMEHWSNFTSLDVSSNSLTSEAAKVLAIGLKECPSHTFQEMLIGNNAIEDSGLKYLASALELKKCTTLDISSNSISSTGLEAIASNLKNIQQLDISGNILDGVSFNIIFAKCASLSKLTLGCITDPEERSLQVLNVVDFIEENSSGLLILDISQCTQDYEALVSNLRCCMQLHELYISHTSLASRVSLAALTSCLSCLSQLTTLSLSFTQIEQEGVKLLASSLISCTYLRTLFIDNNNIGDVGAAAIATIIEKCHQLQVLDVSSNYIGDLGAGSLAKALERSGKLREFNISQNNIKSDGERLLCEALEHCVNINSLNFSSLSLVHVPLSLKTFANLQKLKISRNSVDAHNLSKGLEGCKFLRELAISSCGITNLGAIKIASSLSSTCDVLDISSNDIDGLANVFSFIKDHSSLSHLNFNKNSEKLFCHFSFPSCTKLQTLAISETSLGDHKLHFMSSDLQQCTILQHLYIARNKFTIKGLKVLARILKYFPLLQTLDVSRNNIRDEGAEILADCLQNNPILTTLCIYDCKISQTGVRMLDTALNSDTGRVRTRIEHTHCLPPPVFESNTFC